MEQQRIIVGCMRLAGLGQEAGRFLDHAMELGLSWFDHADIYGGGDCERIFGRWLRSQARDKVILQSKCSIVPGKMYDCSRDYILHAVDGILSRLGTDYLDTLLLHRPDALMEPQEVAEAFDRLSEAGKVRSFGVSNFSTGRLRLLNRWLNGRIQFNQLQFGPAHTGPVRFAMEANNQGAADQDGEVLDYCMRNGITPQAWSPLQHGMIAGCFLNNPDFAPLSDKLAQIGQAHGAAPATVAAAWILRHPAGFQVVSGSTSQAHFDQMAAARELTLTREEWYEIYLAGGNPLP